ncbi:MAG TPA: ammonium transporter [Candidatus Methanofastidiosa archaeon]|nr:ammonium transporter [Candidatus Methanofastidiosa archaeon]
MVEISFIDTVWVLVAGVLVFSMQLGFAAIEAGFTRAKSTMSIWMKNMSDMIIGSIFFMVIGFTIAFSGSGPFIGDLGHFLLKDVGLEAWDGLAIPGILFFFFQMMFAATAATIVSGAVAERIKYIAYFIISIVIIVLTYPVIVHWVWGGGWLAERGFVDFAGSTVVHSVGAWSALAAVIVLGPRIGKYTKEGVPKAIPGHNIALAGIGLFVLWFGWFGFNPGSELAADSAIAMIATTTNLAAAAGGLGAIIVTWLKLKKPDVGMTMNGILAGLVAITAPCAAVTPISSVIIGFIAGIIVVFSVYMFEGKLKIDDPVGAISVHGMCGVWGTLAVGLFATEGGLLTTGAVDLLVTQIIGVVATFAFVFTLMLVVCKIIDIAIGMRVPEAVEISGLDTAEFGGDAYPDFVRT